MPRIELPDGQWAELRERITHGQSKDIQRAVQRARANVELWPDVDTTTIRTFLIDWYVRDVEGNPIPSADPDAIDRAPEDIVDVLYAKAAESYTGATVPNAGTPNSSD